MNKLHPVKQTAMDGAASGNIELLKNFITTLKYRLHLPNDVHHADLRNAGPEHAEVIELLKFK